MTYDDLYKQLQPILNEIYHKTCKEIKEYNPALEYKDVLEYLQFNEINHKQLMDTNELKKIQNNYLSILKSCGFYSTTYFCLYFNDSNFLDMLENKYQLPLYIKIMLDFYSEKRQERIEKQREYERLCGEKKNSIDIVRIDDLEKKGELNFPFFIENRDEFEYLIKSAGYCSIMAFSKEYEMSYTTCAFWNKVRPFPKWLKILLELRRLNNFYEEEILKLLQTDNNKI